MEGKPDVEVELTVEEKSTRTCGNSHVKVMMIRGRGNQEVKDVGKAVQGQYRTWLLRGQGDPPESSIYLLHGTS